MLVAPTACCSRAGRWNPCPPSSLVGLGAVRVWTKHALLGLCAVSLTFAPAHHSCFPFSDTGTFFFFRHTSFRRRLSQHTHDLNPSHVPHVAEGLNVPNRVSVSNLQALGIHGRGREGVRGERARGGWCHTDTEGAQTPQPRHSLSQKIVQTCTLLPLAWTAVPCLEGAEDGPWATQLDSICQALPSWVGGGEAHWANFGVQRTRIR